MADRRLSAYSAYASKIGRSTDSAVHRSPFQTTSTVPSHTALLQSEEDDDDVEEEATPALVPFRIPGGTTGHSAAGRNGGCAQESSDDEDIVVVSVEEGSLAQAGKRRRQSGQPTASHSCSSTPTEHEGTLLHSGLTISPEAFQKLRGIDESNARLSTLHRHTRGLQIWPEVPNVCFPSKRELRYKSRDKIDWEESKRLLMECAAVLHDPVQRCQLESMFEVFMLPVGHPAYCPGEQAKGVRCTRDIEVTQFKVIAQYTAVLKVKEKDMPEAVQRFAWDAWGENERKRDCGPQQCQELVFEAILPHRGTHFVNVNKCPDGKGGSRQWLDTGHNCEPVYVLCRGGCSKPDGRLNPITPNDWHPHVLYMLTQSVSKGEELLLESYGEDYDEAFVDGEVGGSSGSDSSDLHEVEEEDEDIEG